MKVRSKNGRTYNVRYDPGSSQISDGAIAEAFEITGEGSEVPDDFAKSLCASAPETYAIVEDVLVEVSNPIVGGIAPESADNTSFIFGDDSAPVGEPNGSSNPI